MPYSIASESRSAIPNVPFGAHAMSDLSRSMEPIVSIRLVGACHSMTGDGSSTPLFVVIRAANEGNDGSRE